MTDAPDKGNVVHLGDAIDAAKRAAERSQAGDAKKAAERAQADGPKKPAAKKPARKPAVDTSGGEPPFDHYGDDILPSGFPVTPLGQNPSTLFFLCSKRQFHAVEVGKFGRTKILQMVGKRDYLWQNFPAYSRGSNDATGWRHAEVSERMIDACVNASIFDPVNRVREAGAWRDHLDRLIYHAGNALWIGDKAYRPGVLGDMVYPACAALPAPSFCDDDDDGYKPARVVLEAFRTFTWRRGETDAKLLLGWHGCAMLGAFAKVRPAAWITGERSTGKTLLQEITGALHGKSLIEAADATGASLFQMLGFKSLPVAIDELEADADDARAKQVIKLARLSYSGANVLRGSSGGTAMMFQARSCFLFSSILRPAMTPAEISRMAFLDLGKVTATRSLDLTQFATLGQQMRGCLLRGSHRYDATFAAYREALLAAGHKVRSADQFGALGAAYDLLMHDGLTDAAAKAWAQMLPSREMGELADNAPEYSRCLDHLATVAPDVHRGGRTETVGYWLGEARNKWAESNHEVKGEDCVRVLAAHGMRVLLDPRTVDYPPQDQLWWIAVANTHNGLNKLFKDTRWKDGGWSQALKNIEIERGADAPLRSVSNLGSKKTEVLWLDGRSYRCTFVPWAAAFPPEDDGE